MRMSIYSFRATRVKFRPYLKVIMFVIVSTITGCYLSKQSRKIMPHQSGLVFVERGGESGVKRLNYNGTVQNPGL